MGKFKVIGLSIWALISTASIAQTNSLEYVALKCSGKAQPKQPCGGTNTRVIKFMLSDTANERSSGYREQVSYGGCYPISDDTFGTIQNAFQNGDEISFELVHGGSMWTGGIPTVYEPKTAPSGIKPVPARLNLKTMELTLDTKDVSWTYAKPDVLKCAPLR